MRIGVNTYGIGKLLSRDFDETLDALRAAGVTSIEPNIDFGFRTLRTMPIWIGMKLVGLLGGHFPVGKADEKVEAIRKKGLAVRSIQIDNIKWDPASMQAAVDFCRSNQISYAAFSFKESSVASIRKRLPELREMADLFERNGLHFLIHHPHWPQPIAKANCTYHSITAYCCR